MAGDELELVKEANRIAELQLTSEIDLMLAADQRATTFSSIMIAAVAVIAQKYDSDAAIINDDAGLILLGFSAGIATYSARSVKVYTSGNAFSNFQEDIENRRELKIVLKELGNIYDDCSAKNRAIIRKNGRFFNFSLILGVLGFVTSMWPNILALLNYSIQKLCNIAGGWP